MSDKFTIEQAIAESRRIEQAATEGPWSIKSAATAGQYDITAETVGDMVRLVACSMDKDGKGAITHAADACFIAHARNTHRLLLDVAEAYDSLRRIRKLGVACEADYENVDDVLQAFADYMSKSPHAAYMSGETK